MVPQGEQELKELLTEKEFFNYKFYFTPENQETMRTLAQVWPLRGGLKRVKHAIKEIYELGMEDLE